MSADAGSVWNQVDSYFDDGYCLAQDPNDPDIVYAGGIANQAPAVAISMDGGERWTIRQTLPTRSTTYAFYNSCRVIVPSPWESEVVYAAGSDGLDAVIYRSENREGPWIKITNNLPLLFSGDNYIAYIDAILCHPTTRDSLWVGTNEGVFLSIDNGQSWGKTSLVIPTVELAFDSVRNVFFAGTSDGVYQSEDGVDWEPLGDDLRDAQCLCMAIDVENGFLYVGTHGRGTWRFTVQTPLLDWNLY